MWHPPASAPRLAWLAVGAVAFHGTAMVLLHVLVPGVDPMSEMVGAYLESPYRWLSRLTFLALGCALASLGLALRARLSAGLWPRTAAVLLIVATVGFLGVATFPDAGRYLAIPTQPATVLTILTVSILLRREPRWRSVGTVLVLIGAALVVLFVLTIPLGIVMSMGFGGLANRLVLVLIYTWVGLVARGLLVEPASVETGAA